MSDSRDIPIPFAKPTLGDAETAAIAQVIASGWVTQGPQVAAFEDEFASFVGAPHACAVSSATAALHLALHAIGVGRGDEVVTVSSSFIATTNCIRYVGAVPVFVDVEPATGNLDPARLAAAIGPRCKAILVVHQLGLPCDMTAIEQVVAGRVPIVEDAACAIGSEILYRGAWQRIGAPQSAVACFSFHPRKLLTTGDGGMLTTADATLAARLRRLRQHAMSVNDRERHASSRVIFEEYTELGFNYRLTDIQAAMGRVQLQRMPDMVAHRRRLAARYRAALAQLPGVTPPYEPNWARTNWQTYAVRLPHAADQRRIMEAMRGDGIATRRGLMCAHREPAYETEPWSCPGGRPHCGCPPRHCVELAASENLQDHGIMLPMFSEMTEAQQDHVVASLARALDREAAGAGAK